MTTKKCFECGKQCPEKDLKKWGDYDYLCPECTNKFCVPKEEEDYINEDDKNA